MAENELENAALERILREEQVGEHLPALLQSDPGWSLTEWLRRFLTDLLSTLLGDRLPLAGGSEWLWFVLAVGLLMIPLWLGLRFFQGRRGLGHPMAEGPGVGGTARDEPSLRLEQISQALREGDLARAGRLRWKLFLLRVQLPPDLTPSEYGARRRLGSQNSAIEPAHIQLFNRLMFAAASPVLPQFAVLESTLAQLEQGAERDSHV